MRIIIDCNPFLTASHVYYVGDSDSSVSNIQTVSNSMLIGHVVARAEALGVNYIALSGSLPYCNGIKEEIQNKMITEYGNKNIEIEVIKQ